MSADRFRRIGFKCVHCGNVFIHKVLVDALGGLMIGQAVRCPSCCKCLKVRSN